MLSKNVLYESLIITNISCQEQLGGKKIYLFTDTLLWHEHNRSHTRSLHLQLEEGSFSYQRATTFPFHVTPHEFGYPPFSM